MVNDKIPQTKFPPNIPYLKNLESPGEEKAKEFKSSNIFTYKR